MKRRLRLWLLLAVAYALARVAVRYLTVGVWLPDRDIAAHILLVPLSQLAALEVLFALAGPGTGAGVRK